MSDIRTVSVELGERSYDIVIGHELYRNFADYLTPVLGKGRIHVVTDQTVFDLHGYKLEQLGRPYSITCLPGGESQKSFDVLQSLLNDLFTQGLGRSDTVIAFGGGVIGDLTGFAASIFKRGCGFIQIPTTLLAQVDSSVGGKTAINVKQGKNLVGAFYQPSLVLADTSLLSTLPLRELKAGYAEVLKYGLLGDVEFFHWLDENAQAILELEPEKIAHAVAVSCEMKAKIVAKDEHERGQRALLNLGHTFGHALEAEAGYGGDLLHGEAVSAGMEMAFAYSAAQGLCAQDDADRLSSHLKKTKLTDIEAVKNYLQDTRALMAHMSQDKKNEDQKLTLILANAIGNAFVQKDALVDTVRDYLESIK